MNIIYHSFLHRACWLNIKPLINNKCCSIFGLVKIARFSDIHGQQVSILGRQGSLQLSVSLLRRNCAIQLSVSLLQRNCINSTSGWNQRLEILKLIFFIPLKGEAWDLIFWSKNYSPTPLLPYCITPEKDFFSKPYIGSSKLESVCQQNIKTWRDRINLHSWLIFNN